MHRGYAAVLAAAAVLLAVAHLPATVDAKDICGGARCVRRPRVPGQQQHVAGAHVLCSEDTVLHAAHQAARHSNCIRFQPCKPVRSRRHSQQTNERLIGRAICFFCICSSEVCFYLENLQVKAPSGANRFRLPLASPKLGPTGVRTLYGTGTRLLHDVLVGAVSPDGRC